MHTVANPDAGALVGVVDVHYGDDQARSALVVARRPDLSASEHEFVVDVSPIAPYTPGALFERELPCIRAVVAAGPPLELLVVDGYATLDPDGKPGLGARAAAALRIPVIGVAKTSFRTATHAVPVVRGTATRPLYVTAAGGIEAGEAADLVMRMAGPFRIPWALARADRLARGREQPLTSTPPEP